MPHASLAQACCRAFCAHLLHVRVLESSLVDVPAQLSLGKRQRATCTPHRINTEHANERPCARKARQARCKADDRTPGSQKFGRHSRPNAQTPEPHDPTLSRRAHSLRSLPASARAGHLRWLGASAPSERSKGQSLYRGERGFCLLTKHFLK